ncbi:MAG: TrmH family RNA methyltransferase [Bacteroidota bacterium]
MRKLRHHEIPRPDPTAVAALLRHPIHVVVDNVRSIYNVGSIFRTSDAARIAQLHLTGITGTPDHRKLHKTALGAQDTVPWTHERDGAVVLQDLRAAGCTVAVLELTDTPTRIHTLTPAQFPLALVVGNEVGGVSDRFVDEADLALEIPQYGAKQSLNVAVAYGIAIFDLVRHYRQLTGGLE